MAEPIKIEQYGDQLIIHMDDNSKRTGVPTMGGLFYVNDKYVPPVPPPVEPPPPTSGARFQWPFGLNTVTSEYGPRSGRVHQGIDFGKNGVTHGTPIVAAGAGRVMHRYNSGFGWHVILDHGGGLFTVYAHMPNGGYSTADGAQVAKGQRIGTVGNSGRSYGAHLHWETHVGGLNWNNPGTHRNPRDFMAQYAG